MFLRGLTPELPVQRAVLDRLGDVLRQELIGSRQIGDGAGDFQELVVGAGGDVELLHGLMEQRVRLGGHGAGRADLAVAQLRVGQQAGGFEAPALPTTGGQDPSFDRCGRVPLPDLRERGKRNRRHFDVQVDAIQQRAGDLTQVLLDLPRRAVTNPNVSLEQRRVCDTIEKATPLDTYYTFKFELNESSFNRSAGNFTVKTNVSFDRTIWNYEYNFVQDCALGSTGSCNFKRPTA